MSVRKNRVREFTTTMFLHDPGIVLNDDDSLLATQVVDSTGFLELVGFLETEFKIRVTDDEMVPENLDSLDNIDQFLTRKLGS